MNRHFWRINHLPNHTTLKYGFWCFENIIIEILVLVLNAATVIGCQVVILLTIQPEASTGRYNIY